MTSFATFDTFDTSRTDLTPEPLNPDWIKEGSPVARSVYVTESPDKTLRAGLWECTAGKFKFIYYFDEIVQILEGEAHVHDGRSLRTLSPGMVVHFHKDLVLDWDVPKYIKKTFILRSLKPNRVRLAAHKVKVSVLKRLGMGQ